MEGATTPLKPTVAKVEGSNSCTMTEIVSSAGGQVQFADHGDLQLLTFNS